MSTMSPSPRFAVSTFAAIATAALVTGCGALASVQGAAQSASASAAALSDPQAALKSAAQSQLESSAPGVASLADTANSAKTAAANPTAALAAKTMTPTSVELKNECTKTMGVFFGENPKFGSGTKSSVGGNSIQSIARKSDGTVTVWLLDSAGAPLTNAKANTSTKRITIDGKCTSVRAD